MDTQLNLAALALFTFASSITPGPNNVLVMRSGARFGLRPTGVHVMGIEAGVALLVVLAHAGVGALLLARPAAFEALRWACVAYLMWLAWKVLRDTGPISGTSHDARPMGLGSAAAFQFVNPKAWMMAVTAVTAFSTGGRLDAAGLATVILVFLVIGTPCVFVWAVWGAALHRVLHKPGARRVFNVCMAVLVAASALLVLQE